MSDDGLLHPLKVDGVMHKSSCRVFAYWNGKDEPEKCSCGAECICSNPQQVDHRCKYCTTDSASPDTNAGANRVRAQEGGK